VRNVDDFTTDQLFILFNFNFPYLYFLFNLISFVLNFLVYFLSIKKEDENKNLKKREGEKNKYINMRYNK